MAALRLRPSRIAVVEMYGVIGTTLSVARLEPMLESVRKSRFVRAVVLDIDSPGGTASASEALYLALRRIAEEKPLVAFLRGSGTSGAYMAACAAHRVVAVPNAMVGSIGVIYARPLGQRLLKRHGLAVAVHKRGALKDMGAMYRAPTEEEQQRLQGLVDDIYGALVEMVGQARGLEGERLKQVTTGEVFTARQGQALGLVDQLGDLDTAIEVAMELGRVPRRVTRVRPKRGLRGRLLGRLGSTVLEDVAAGGSIVGLLTGEALAPYQAWLL